MPITIDPATIYREGDVVLHLGMTSAVLKRARDRGELRTKEVGRGRRVYLGAWLIEWLAGPEALAAMIAKGQTAAHGPDTPPVDPAASQEEQSPPQYVTLDQAAVLVGRSKRTLMHYLYDERKQARYGMPDPSVDGGGGRPNEWDWAVLRPWLEKTFGRKLPERHPACL